MKNKYVKRIVIFISILLFIVIVNYTVNSVTNYNFLSSVAKVLLNTFGVYTEDEKNIVYKDSHDGSGSWTINSNVKWIEKNKIQVNYDLTSVIDSYNKNKDIILLIDTSGSMQGDKLNEVKDNSIELLDTLLENENNKVAIIGFNSTSKIIQEFTNDKEILIEKINSLTATGGTNYNAALTNLDKILSEYVKEDNKDLVVMFLTDGYPVEENPNQVSTYQIIKSKYDYLVINGIQYEMGSKVKEEIKEVTDRQYIADITNIDNVLLEVLVSSKIYDQFEIKEYISKYFQIDEKDIKASIGNVKLNIKDEKQELVWNISKTYITGARENMSFIATLKDEYQNNASYYPVNENLVVNYKLPGEMEESYNSDKSLVLSNAYNVHYELNTPEGCSLDEIEDKKYFVYSNVKISEQELSCTGYLFKGFEVQNDDVIKVNDNVFIMPEENVVIGAKWTKQSLTKTMNGEVKEKTTLYKTLESEANTSSLVSKYTGEHMDSYTKNGEYDIYYFNGSNSTQILNKNNVVFADHCWQILRTTDTGGVKLIYNGLVDSDGKCGTNRSNHVGYSGTTSLNLNSEYYYGTSYTYDSLTNTFSLDGTKRKAKWSESVGPTLVGEYTCKSSTEDATCSTLYLVESYKDSSNGNMIKIVSNSTYSQFGTLPFNTNYNSPAYVGYMYGTPYTYSTINFKSTQSFTQRVTLLNSSSLSTSYYYADSIEYTSNKYVLNNPIKITSNDEYSSLVGKYTFRQTSQSYTSNSVYYIAYVNGSNMYYYNLTKGNDITTIIMGDSITDNNDGTYTINNADSFNLTSWYTDYNNYVGKYTCDNNSTSCENPRYITSTTSTGYDYINAVDKILISKERNGLNLSDTLVIRKDELIKQKENYTDYKYTCNTLSATCTESSLRMITSYTSSGYEYIPNRYYASSVTYSNGKYTLTNPLEIENVSSSSLSSNHYSCAKIGEKECTSVIYGYYLSGNRLYYITLKNGELNVNIALDKMFKNNTYNSTIKTGIDAWYEKYLKDYSGYLEDTIYCNDRSYINFSSSGLNENGGNLSIYLQFKGYNNNSNLKCSNETDQFSVSNNKAKLKYPIGLATLEEMNLIGSSVRKTGQWYWLSSPSFFNYRNAFVRVVLSGGDLNDGRLNNAYGVRPVVSLNSGTEYISGDGSVDRPYVIE